MKAKIRMLLFTICFFVCSFSLTAQESIKFTWTVVGNKAFELCLDLDVEYTIDWGDGSPIENRVGNYWEWVGHTYVNLNDYQVIITNVNKDWGFGWFNCTGSNVTSLDMSRNQALSILSCANNQLTNLDLSKNPYLMQIDCRNNQLTNLDLSIDPKYDLYISCDNNQLTNLDLSKYHGLNSLSCKNNQLINLDLSSSFGVSKPRIDCSDNQLSLSKLFAIYQKIPIPFYSTLGTQNLEISNAVIVDFSSETEFNGIATVFDVQKDNLSAIINVDYTLTNGIITYKKSGNYVVTMTNAAIETPAEVVAEFNVSIDGVIDVTQSSKFIIYPNPNSGYVYIKTENEIILEIKLFSMDGKLLQNVRGLDIDMSNYPAGIYFLIMKDKQENIYSTKIIKM
jgi:hypothetical protein